MATTDDDAEVYECPACGRDDFTNRHGLETHRRRIHGGTSNPTCSECGRDDFESGLGLAMHHDRSHGNGKRAKLVESLREAAERLDRVPKTTDARAGELAASYPTYNKHFGSWSAALKEAGLTPNYEFNIGEESLLEELTRLASDLGRVPSTNHLWKHGNYSLPTYIDRFGSWNAALEEAGLETNHRVNIPREELLTELRRLRDELGRRLSHRDMAEYGKFSHGVYQLRFGSWDEALEAAGLAPYENGRLTRADLARSLRRFYNELGHVPRNSEMGQDGPHSTGTYYRMFGPWPDSLAAAGLELPAEESESLGYGPNWQQRREEVLDRDNNACQACGITDEESAAEYNKGLNIHHVIPRSKFAEDGVLDHKRANRDENLVSLCISCHRSWEGVPLRPSLIN